MTCIILFITLCYLIGIRHLEKERDIIIKSIEGRLEQFRKRLAETIKESE